MENNLNQAVNSGAVKQSYTSNKITALKYLIRSFFLLALFLGGYGLGIVMGSGQLASMKARVGVTDGDFTLNPVYSGVSVQGKLKSRSADVIVLERDGSELALNLENEVSIFDIKAASTAYQNSSEALISKKLEEIEIGTSLSANAIIKKDEATSKADLFVNSIIIN